MSQRVSIKFKPGGLNTDVVETELGNQEFVEVQNLRPNKLGEWVNDRGYASIKSGLSDIQSAIEITDDLSGERFIIYHAGNSIYRLNYDAGDGNGYENETPIMLILPEGVSFSANDKVLFRWDNRVLRIVGGSHPLRYEYIKRNLFDSAEELISEDTFAIDTEGWTPGNYASITRVSGGVPVSGGDAYDLQVTQTGSTGNWCYKGFTVENGESYVVRCWVQGSGSGDKIVKVGITQNDDSYGSQTIASSDTEWRLVEISFIATQSVVYVTYQPSSGYSSDTGHIDNFRLYKRLTKSYDNWYLHKAEVANTQGLLGTDYWYLKNVLNVKMQNSANGITLLGCNVLDGTQYTLPFDFKKDTTATFESNPGAQTVSAEIYVNEKMFSDQARVTALGLVVDAGLVDGDVVNKQRILGDVLDFSIELQDVIYQHDSLGWEIANPNQLKLIKVIDSSSSVLYSNNAYLTPGNIIHLENRNGWTDLLIVDVDTSASIDNATLYYVKVEGPISPLLSEGISNEDLPSTKITVKRRIEFDGSYYKFWMACDVFNDSDYYDATGFPPGVSKIFYSYKDFTIVNGRGFIISNEAGEEDLIRFSISNMPDVYPSTYYFQTEIGDSDKNKAIVKFGDRLIVLKEKSLSKISYYGDSFTTDVGFVNRGLHSWRGFIVINELLYFMDKEDIYLFDGINVRPFLKNEKVRKKYKADVDTDSFFMYNKHDNELWIVLSGNDILVYNYDYDLWRTVNFGTLNLQDWYQSAESNMIGVQSSAFQDFNHDSDIYSGFMSVKFKTRLVDTENPEQFKKLVRLSLTSKSSQDVQIRVECVESGAVGTTYISPSSTEVTTVENWQKKTLFKNAEITVYTNSATNLDFKFRSLLMEFIKWR